MSSQSYSVCISYHVSSGLFKQWIKIKKGDGKKTIEDVMGMTHYWVSHECSDSEGKHFDCPLVVGCCKSLDKFLNSPITGELCLSGPFFVKN